MKPYLLYANFRHVGDQAIAHALQGDRGDLDRRIAQELTDLDRRDPAGAAVVWETSAERFMHDPHMPNGILAFVGQTLHA